MKLNSTTNPTYSMLFIISALVLLYCLTTAFSIVLLGDKGLLSNNLLQPKNIILLILNWKFILSMALAIMARISFTLINNLLLKIPQYTGFATTLSVFITLLSIIFILLANHFILKESLNLKQAIGACIVLTGVFIMLYP